MLVRASSGSGGGGGSSEPELIWANPNQYSAFASQTVDPSTSGWVSGKSVSDYDGFIIAYIDYAYNQPSRRVGMAYIDKDVTGMADISARYSAVLTYTTGEAVSPRHVTMAANGITFDGSGLYIVPWYIWGVKGVLSNT